MKNFKLFLLSALLIIGVQTFGQDPAENWPADGQALNWVSGFSIDPDNAYQVTDRKENYLVAFHYYKGFTLREAGVIQVSTDAFLYDLPQGSVDDRLMNDALVALMKRGIRVDVTRRGEWVEIGPWVKNRALIYDTRNWPKPPKE